MRAFALLATAAVLAVSGCGSNDDGTDATAGSSTPKGSSQTESPPPSNPDEVDPSMGRQGVGGLCANEALMDDGGIYTAALSRYEVDHGDQGWIKPGQVGALLTMTLRNSGTALAKADSSEFRLLVGDAEVEAERIGSDSDGWDSNENGIGFRGDDTAAAGESIKGSFIFRPSEKDLADGTAVVVLGGGERVCAKVD